MVPLGYDYGWESTEIGELQSLNSHKHLTSSTPECTPLKNAERIQLLESKLNQCLNDLSLHKKSIESIQSAIIPLLHNNKTPASKFNRSRNTKNQ